MPAISTGVSVLRQNGALDGFLASKCTKSRFRPRSGSCLRRFPDPLVGWEGDTPPVPFHFDAFGASALAYHFYASSAPVVRPIPSNWEGVRSWVFFGTQARICKFCHIDAKDYKYCCLVCICNCYSRCFLS